MFGYIMKNILFKIIVCTCLLCTIPASAVYVLDVTTENQDGTPVPRLEFPGIDGLVVGGNLWIASPQFIHVRYGSHEVHWSIRLVTKNNEDIGRVYPKPLDPGPDEAWEWVRQGFSSYQYVGGVWDTGDDIVTYGGLINTATRNDPNSRAPLAWQVFRYGDPYNPPPMGMVINPPTAINDDAVGGGPIDEWSFMGDAGDRGYVLDSVNDYFWVAYGSGIFSLLAQHPVVYRNPRGEARPKPGEGNMGIYVGARFGKRAPDGVTDVGILPAGDYNTVIYLELIHW